jgi:hypothetical protein
MNIIKLDLGEIEWGVEDWIGLAQGRDKWRVLVNMVMNFRVSKNAVKFLNGFTTGGFWSSAQFHIVFSHER